MAVVSDTLSRAELLRSIFGAESSRAGEEALERGLEVATNGIANGATGATEAVAATRELSHGLANDILQNIDGVTGGVVRLTENPLFQITTTVSIFIYLLWIIRYISHRQRGDYSEQRWIYGDDDDKRANSISFNFSDIVLSLSIMMGLVTMLIATLTDWVVVDGGCSEYIDSNGALINEFRRLEQIGLEQIMIAVSSYLLLSVVWFTLVYMLSSLNRRDENPWSYMIMKLKSQIILPIMLFFMPFVALAALIDENDTLRYIVVIEAFVFTLIYLLRSFLLFASKKISILQWFLYLCIVEFLPVTIIWAVFVRSVNIN